MKQRQPLASMLVLLLIVGKVPMVTAQDPTPRFERDVLDHPKEHALELDLRLNVVLTERYHPTDDLTRIILPNGFAKSRLVGEWPSTPGEENVSQVDIICSDWPRNKSKWQPNYHMLLADRIKEILAARPELNSKKIVWNIVLQTDCTTRDEAKGLFHGMAITFSDQPQAPVQTGDFAGLVDPAVNLIVEPIENKQQLLDELKQWASIDGQVDSTVIKVLERHPQWKNMLVVMDWTSSMYAYGGQAILWQALHAQEDAIKYFSFFNDGDQRFDKPLGKAGGIYYFEDGNLEDMVAMMTLVRSRGDGGDIPENDFEALMKSMKHFPNFTEVVLIADNNAWVRDFELLDSLTVPVHTIVCGNYFGINSCYVNLAYRTGGSVHTIEEDIYNLASKLEDGLVLIEGTNYQLTSGDLLIPLAENNANLASDK